ncbi:MAG: hypothetical protein U0168_00735 [Nannocystaceae bacterium]
MLAVLAAIAMLAGAAVGLVAWSGLPHYDDVAPPTITLPSDAAALDRGRRLVGLACRRCHAAADGGPLRGRALAELPQRFGRVHAANLTRDGAAGIAAWDDGELARLLRTGIDREGRFVPPYMPRYTRMASDDLAAVLAFLRSEHPWTAPDGTRAPASAPSLWVKLHALYDWHPPHLPQQDIAVPSRDDPVALGRYLVEDVLQCNDCHGSGPEVIALEHPTDDAGYLGGGMLLRDRNGEAIFAANISFDVDHGIGSWDYDTFHRAVVDGFGPDGALVRWPMPRFGQLDDVEVAAIFAYLAAAPHVARAVPESADYKVPGPRLDPGRHVFFRAGCHYCHGREPAELRSWAAAAIVHFPDDAALARFVADPSRARPDAEMPGFGEVLSEADRLAVAAHVRSLAEGAARK